MELRAVLIIGVAALSVLSLWSTPAPAQSFLPAPVESTVEDGAATEQPGELPDRSVLVPEPLTLDAPQSLEPLAQPMAPAETESDAVQPGDVGTTSNRIQVDVLETLDADSAGTLGELDGGFGDAAWRGTTRAEVRDLIEDLPNPVGSLTLRNLIRRLILSRAAVPDGTQHEEAGGFIELRLKTLGEMGDLDALRQLLAVVPGRERNFRFARIETEADLASGNYPQACGKATIGTRESTDAFWQQLLIMCQALAGSRTEADLGLSLLQEFGQTDAAFDMLIRALIDERPAELGHLPRATPLHIALFRLSRSTLDAKAMADLHTASPAVLAALANSKHLETDVRIAMAEALARSGGGDGDSMRRLLENLEFEASQLASPISASEDLDDFQALALLFQASRSQDIDAARAEAAAAAIERARRGGIYGAAAQAFLPIIRSIPARTDLVWFAADAARVLIMAGDMALARGWVSILRSAALLDNEASVSLQQLTPLIHLSGLGQRPVLNEEITRWWSDAADRTGGRRQAATLFTYIDALEPGASAGLWRIIGGRAGVRGGLGADLGLWHRISAAAGQPDADQNSAETDRVGQGQIDRQQNALQWNDRRAPGLAVLLAAHLLGAGGFADADPLVVQHVVRQLLAIGFEAEARALVIEAAALQGL